MRLDKIDSDEGEEVEAAAAEVVAFMAIVRRRWLFQELLYKFVTRRANAGFSCLSD